jgi:hypothetical protein
VIGKVGCESFAQRVGITTTQLYAWNTMLGAGGANCGTQLWLKKLLLRWCLFVIVIPRGIGYSMRDYRRLYIDDVENAEPRQCSDIVMS